MSRKLPVGVGISVDRSTGRLLAPAVQLTYAPDGTRTWTDGHSGAMFNLFNEAVIGPPDQEIVAYDALGIRIFHNASQLDAAWRQTFADGSLRGGELARAPDMLDYYDKYFAHDDWFVLAQRPIGLYTVRLNASTMQLNSFARQAISQLTPTFNAQLYEDFLDAWGTHIITKSLIGGMLEERAKVKRCLTIFGDDAVSQCIPFSIRNPSGSDCSNYVSRSRVTWKRRLGGNVELNDEDWKKTLAPGPALLQILEMVPWYDFVSDEVVKENLRTSIRYRLALADASRVEAVRQVNARHPPWSPTFNLNLGDGANLCLPRSNTELYPPRCAIRRPNGNSGLWFTFGFIKKLPVCSSLVSTPVPPACVANQFNCRPTSNTDFKVTYERDNSNNLVRVALYNITTIEHPSWFNTRQIESDLYLTTEDYYYYGNRSNSWLIRGTSRDVIIDTGLGLCNLKQHLERLGLLDSNRECIVICTHSHFDHSGGAHHFDNVLIHQGDYEGLSTGDELTTLNWSRPSHYRAQPYANFSADQYKVPPTKCKPIEDGHRINLGADDDEIEIIHVPGHTPGSIVCYYPKKQALFTGDFVYDCENGKYLYDHLPTSSISDYLKSAEYMIDWLYKHKEYDTIQQRSTSPPLGNYLSIDAQLPYFERTVIVSVEKSKRLGLVIRGDAEYGVGIFMSGVDKGSLSDQADLSIGDQILSVNGIDFRHITHADAVQLLRNLDKIKTSPRLYPRIINKTKSQYDLSSTFQNNFINSNRNLFQLIINKDDQAKIKYLINQYQLNEIHIDQSIQLL
ncbi:unnamed protein product [Rotaria sordida]|uniref:PDZ domain-containing protein n=1 Tax=Rotaria sordida TaxID=392033 RepID=A0A814K052_9BILA|nr:unnamed protein product [Rotaria sordida]